MAGIGFELKKMFSKKGVFQLIRAYGYGVEQYILDGHDAVRGGQSLQRQQGSCASGVLGKHLRNAYLR